MSMPVCRDFSAIQVTIAWRVICSAIFRGVRDECVNWFRWLYWCLYWRLDGFWFYRCLFCFNWTVGMGNCSVIVDKRFVWGNIIVFAEQFSSPMSAHLVSRLWSISYVNIWFRRWKVLVCISLNEKIITPILFSI